MALWQRNADGTFSRADTDTPLPGPVGGLALPPYIRDRWTNTRHYFTSTPTVDTYGGDPGRMSVRPYTPDDSTPDVLSSARKATARNLRVIRAIDADPLYSVPLAVFATVQREAMAADLRHARHVNDLQSARNIVANQRQAVISPLVDTVYAGVRGERAVTLVTFATDATDDRSQLTTHLMRLGSLSQAVEDHSEGNPSQWREMFNRGDGSLVVETFDGFNVTRTVITPTPDESDDWVVDERERAKVVNLAIASKGRKRGNRHTGKSGFALTPAEKQALYRARKAGKVNDNGNGNLPASNGSRLSPGVATNGAPSYVNVGQ